MSKLQKMSKPTQCIDPEYKFCQECIYGIITYPSWVETSEDLNGVSFKVSCLYNLDKLKEDLYGNF